MDIIRLSKLLALLTTAIAVGAGLAAIAADPAGRLAPAAMITVMAFTAQAAFTRRLSPSAFVYAMFASLAVFGAFFHGPWFLLAAIMCWSGHHVLRLLPAGTR
ncbi:hypothetical protein GCM10023346_46250 [Arthrobacter gyeryongensis]|uniref:Uncharacterized protein n=1 Tax=Arthrobacter gyeryongensis TaxID=1650592 RepID=A0ABP9SVR7_9MICC